MTVASPDQIEDVDLSTFEEFDLPCDGPRIWPEYLGVHDDPARWIGLKHCGHHRLFCDKCRDAYLKIIAHDPAFNCADCAAVGNDQLERKFIGFEPLNGKM